MQIETITIERVPEFWEWLEYNGSIGNVKIPEEIYDEIKQGNDNLAAWIKKKDVKEALIFNNEPKPTLVNRAVAQGYASNLKDDELPKLGRDPFLLGYVLVDTSNFCIVTTEVSKPSKRRANKHLPDAASNLGIDTCTTFEFVRKLDFSTNWQ